MEQRSVCHDKTIGEKSELSWNLLGDLKLGRPNLGFSARLEVYRLMQFQFQRCA